MQLKGLDSSFAQPMPGQAIRAMKDGYQVWAGYVSGSGASTWWKASAIANVLASGMAFVPIMVPDLSLTNVPDAGVAFAITRMRAFGLPLKTLTLDTEESMISLPNLHEYVDGFCSACERAGLVPAVYSGAHYVPGGVADWAPLWGKNVTPTEGHAVQYGPATVLGMSVDVNIFDSSYPMIGGPVPQVTSSSVGPSSGHLAAPVVASDKTPSGNGYVMVAADGGVFAFGDAVYCGNLVGKNLVGPPVDIALTPTGKGYWIFASDGGVFTFGDAQFHGSAA